MKLLNQDQIRNWDLFTINNEPIKSIDLMERASLTFCDWFEFQIGYNRDKNVKVFCGPGNNGGDGLAIARILNERSYNITVFLCNISEVKSKDFNHNLEILPLRNGIKLYQINKEDKMIINLNKATVIDAIFGSGLSRSLSGYWADLIEYINQSTNNIYSVDIPSGMFCDLVSQGPTICAKNVLSFELPKLSFFFSDNGASFLNWDFRSIGLLQSGLDQFESNFYYLGKNEVNDLLQERTKFQHKGNFGHALLIGGSIGMMGAITLASKACLRSGVGLLSIAIPSCGQDIIQIAVPEAMFIENSGKNYLNVVDVPENISALGVGPGMGNNEESFQTITKLLIRNAIKMVIDADALNIISSQNLQSNLPPGCILTPHPKEFDRLFGKSKDSHERIKLQIEKSKIHNIYIVLKGANTSITFPDGRCYFNSTGNPGMATGGSGDVLTGILTSLITQGYETCDAVLLGVYLHGLAGDFAAAELGQHSMISSDIINFLPNAFKSIVNE